MMDSSTQKRQSIFGFDFGLKRIGLAVGQLLTKTSSPLMIIEAQQAAINWSQIEDLIAQWKPAACVVGIPFNMDDSDSEMSLLAKAFAAELRLKTGLPVHEVDERLSSRAARDRVASDHGTSRLKYKGKNKKTRVDSVAAQVILDAWLLGQ